MIVNINIVGFLLALKIANNLKKRTEKNKTLKRLTHKKQTKKPKTSNVSVTSLRQKLRTSSASRLCVSLRWEFHSVVMKTGFTKLP